MIEAATDSQLDVFEAPIDLDGYATLLGCVDERPRVWAIEGVGARHERCHGLVR